MAIELDENQIQMVESMARAGAYQKNIAAALDMSSSTLCEIFKRQPDVRERYDAARESIGIRATNGRPEHFLSDDQVIQVERMAKVLTREQIADFFGISQDVFRRIRKDQPAVDLAYKRGRSNSVGEVASSLVQRALDGDMTAAIFYLKTQGRWSTQQKIEHSTPGSKSLTISIEGAPGDDE